MAAELLSTISPSKEYGGIGGSSILREVRQLLSDMNVDAFILSTGGATSLFLPIFLPLT